MNFPYEDIVTLPHKRSDAHPQMPMKDRAAQFSAFAALTGFEDKIEETARTTELKAVLDEDAMELLNEQLSIINDRISEAPNASITYFLADKTKSGGAYVTVSGRVKRIDAVARRVIFADGGSVKIDDIRLIEP